MQDVSAVSKLISYLLVFALSLAPGVLVRLTVTAKQKAAIALKTKTVSYGRWNHALLRGGGK